MAQQFVGERSIKLLNCSRESTAAMKQYFKNLQAAKAAGEPVVWTATWEPQEIFRVMDINIYFMVHYAALSAAKQLSMRYLGNLQEEGFSKDICRYCGQRLGFVLDKNKEDAPWGGPPTPDLEVKSCVDDLQDKILEYKAKALGFPLYLMDRTWPTRVSKGMWHTWDTEDYRLEYAMKQYRQLIAFLENFFHRRLDMEKLKEAVRNTVEMFRLWWEVDQLRKTIPAPITTADHYSNIIPIQFFRGTKQGIEMLTKYRDEVKERVDKGLAAVPNERIRLFWPEIAPWFTPGIFNAFEDKYGAAFVFDQYHYPEWFHQVDPEKPIESLAKLYAAPYAEDYANAPGKVEWTVEHARDYSIDGVVIMWAESCKAFCNSLLLMQRALSKVGIPSIIIKGDIVDIRDWHDQKIKSEIGDFIETLDPSRRPESKRRATEFLEQMGSTLR